MRSTFTMIASLVVALNLTFSSVTARHAEVTISQALPREINSYLEKNLSGWKVVELSDLLPEDKERWLSQHPNDNPGFTTGQFRPGRSSDFAVALISKNKKDRRTKLVLFRRVKNGYAAQTLLELPIANPPVVFQMPAGTYKNWDQTKEVHTKYPVIFYVHYEASATMFYWSGSRYRRLQISD